ncbi:MAG: transposase, partial [Phycisphaerae bacterium]
LRDLRNHCALTPGTVGWIKWLRDVELPGESRWVITQQLDELDGINKRIVTAQERLQEVTAEDRIVNKLLEIKGIGLVTACVLRAEIGDATRFRNGKQLARFCGLSPRNASSGERQADAGLIGSCSRQLRATLVEAAHRLKRFDVRWAKLANTLKERGKPGSVIAAAVANRWVRGLYHDLVAIKLAA